MRYRCKKCDPNNIKKSDMHHGICLNETLHFSIPIIIFGVIIFDQKREKLVETQKFRDYLSNKAPRTELEI